jgi:hypothetical protein
LLLEDKRFVPSRVRLRNPHPSSGHALCVAWILSHLKAAVASESLMNKPGNGRQDVEAGRPGQEHTDNGGQGWLSTRLLSLEEQTTFNPFQQIHVELMEMQFFP